jgi:hypothetical protein
MVLVLGAEDVSIWIKEFLEVIYANVDIRLNLFQELVRITKSVRIKKLHDQLNSQFLY